MKSSNLIYILFHILLLLALITLNIAADPYFLLRKNRPMHISRYLLDEPYIPLKLHNNNKYKIVIAGGSTVNVLNLQNFNKNIADISCFRITTEDMGKILFLFLDKHPEVKTVIFPVDFRQLCALTNHKIPDYKEDRLTTEEIFRLLLSGKTIKYSINKILKRIPTYNTGLVKFKTHEIKISSEEVEKKAYKAYDDIFKELKKRNIKAICFVTPVHASRMVYLEENLGYETMLNIKKYIISQNGYLIDMSTLNKFTSMPLKDSFYLFSDAIHPTDIYGYYIYNILFNTPEKDKELYTVLTKENIEKESHLQHEKLKNWLSANKKEYIYYEKGRKLKYKENISKNLNDVPLEFRNILNYKKSIFYKN